MAVIFQKCKREDPPCEKKRCGHPWTARYWEPDTSRQRERSFPRKAEAENFATEVEDGKRTGKYLDPTRGKISVVKFTDIWLDNAMINDATRDGYRRFFDNHVIPSIGRKRIIAVNAADIQKLVTNLSKNGMAASTIKSRMTPLSAFFAFAIKDKRIGENPCKEVDLPRTASIAVDEDEIPTLAEVRLIAEKMPAWSRVSIWLMAGIGLRISEAMAVTDDCVRRGRSGRMFRVRQQAAHRNRKAVLVPLKHRADGDHREIPLAPFVAKKIAEHIDEFGTFVVQGQKGLLFRAQRGGLATKESFYYQWKTALAEAGLVDDEGKAKYTPHSLRHFFASTALHNRCSLVEVSRWLGHSSIQVTVDIYGHLTEESPERMREAMDAALSAA